MDEESIADWEMRLLGLRKTRELILETGKGSLKIIDRRIKNTLELIEIYKRGQKE